MIRSILFLLLVALPLKGMCQNTDVDESTMNTQLSQVTIESAKIIHHNDYDIYYPSHLQRLHSANAVDLISLINLPGIHVDQVQKRITNSMSNGNVIVKINNVQSTFDYLQTIPSKQISYIEYISTPGLKYGSNVSAVINVKVKRSDLGVAGGVNAMNAILNNYNDDGVWFKGWNKKMELGMQYNFKLNNINNAYTQGYETFKYLNGTTKQYAKDGHYRGGNYRSDVLNMSYNYVLPNKRMFDVKATFNSSRFPNRMLIENIISEDETYSMQTNTQSNEKLGMLKTHYEENFRNNNTLEINGGFAYVDNAYDRGFISPYNTNTYNVCGKKCIVQANVDYSHDFSSNSKMNIGYQHYNAYTKNKYVGTNNLLMKSHDNSEYIYAEYLFSFNKIHFTLGAGEKRLSMKQTEDKFIFYSFMPQVILRYKLNKQWMCMYKYNRNPTSPTMADLTEFFHQDDVRQASIGNAKLKPYGTDSHLILTNFNKGNTSLRLYGLYEYTHHGIGLITEEQNGLFLHKKYNNMNHRHVEAAIYWGQLLFNKALNFYVEPQWVYDHSMGTFNNSNSYLSLQAGLDAFYKSWNLSIYYRTATEDLLGDILVHNNATSDLNIGYRYHALQLKVGLRNAFNKIGKVSTTNRESSLYKCTILQGNHTFGNMVYITFSWNFMKGKMTRRPRINELNMDTDAGIVK